MFFKNIVFITGVSALSNNSPQEDDTAEVGKLPPLVPIFPKILDPICIQACAADPWGAYPFYPVSWSKPKACPIYKGNCTHDCKDKPLLDKYNITQGWQEGVCGAYSSPPKHATKKHWENAYALCWIPKVNKSMGQRMCNSTIQRSWNKTRDNSTCGDQNLPCVSTVDGTCEMPKGNFFTQESADGDQYTSCQSSCLRICESAIHDWPLDGGYGFDAHYQYAHPQEGYPKIPFWNPPATKRPSYFGPHGQA